MTGLLPVWTARVCRACRTAIAPGFAAGGITFCLTLALSGPTAVSASSTSAASDVRNGRIAFTALRYLNDSDFSTFVQTVQPDGSRRRTLPCATKVGLRGCDDSHPSYSQDGARLATSGVELGGVAIRQPGGRILRVVDGDGPVAWSPHRRFLAFSGFPFRLLDLRTNQSRRLRGRPNAVRWSRKGSLLFDSSVDEGFTVRRPDGRRRRILRGVSGFPADWSPGGRRFAYACNGICIAKSDGSGRRVLTRACAPLSDQDGFAWSPDGRKVVCVADRDRFGRLRGLITVDVRTKRIRVVIPGAVNIGPMDWQPLGRQK